MFEIKFNSGVSADLYKCITFYTLYREQKYIRESLGQDPKCRNFLNRLRLNLNYHELQRKYGLPNKSGG